MAFDPLGNGATGSATEFSTGYPDTRGRLLFGPAYDIMTS